MEMVNFQTVFSVFSDDIGATFGKLKGTVFHWFSCKEKWFPLERKSDFYGRLTRLKERGTRVETGRFFDEGGHEEWAMSYSHGDREKNWRFWHVNCVLSLREKEVLVRVAVTYSDNEEYLGLALEHVRLANKMIKFGSPHYQGFKTLCQKLENEIHDALDIVRGASK